MNIDFSSFAEFVSQHDAARFTDWLRLKAGDVWTQATEHRFTKEIADDSLPEATFKRYLLQEYSFVETSIIVNAYSLAKAPSMTEKAHIVQGLVGLTTTQDRYFKDTFRNVGMSLEECAAFEPPRSVLAFQDFVVRTAIEESYEGSLVVVLAAEWMYLTWSKEAYQYGPRNPHYAEWIRIHVSPDFEANVGWIRQQLDTNGPMLALHRQQRLAFLFRRTLELEVDFHNAPYDHLPTGSR